MINTPEIQQLKQYTQHHYGTRYDHVIAVSYLSYRMALYMGLDATSIARAGILHDYYYYDWHDEGMSMSEHAFVHPQVALDNAKHLASTEGMKVTLSGAMMSMRFGRHRRIKSIRQTH